MQREGYLTKTLARSKVRAARTMLLAAAVARDATVDAELLQRNLGAWWASTMRAPLHRIRRISICRQMVVVPLDFPAPEQLRNGCIAMAPSGGRHCGEGRYQSGRVKSLKRGATRSIGAPARW